MLRDISTKYNVILGSSSPRRKELLEDLGIIFSIKRTNKDEKYPLKLEVSEIPKFLARKKAYYLFDNLNNNKTLLITADTIVLLNNTVLNKPKNKKDAFRMLQCLSNQTHKVITGVCIKTKNKEFIFSSTTMVTFKKLSELEIKFYIDTFNPLDKAGSYGIQEWIGKIGVKKILGSYTNVVGLPLKELYENLQKFN